MKTINFNSKIDQHKLKSTLLTNNLNGAKMNIFRLTLITVLSFTSLIGFGQKENNLKLNIELDLVQPLLGGYGGTIGLENNHWGAGFMGFNTTLTSASRDIIMNGAEDFSIQNWGLEFYTEYYLKEEHKGFHFGALVSVDGYQMNHTTSPTETIIGVYAMPKIGYRWIMFKKLDWLYLQPSIATPILVWDNAAKIETADVDLSRVLFLPFLTLGVKFSL
ncbi:MAG: hypothetical protein ACI8ZM_004569 [Crocinitomix sp.]|jgi:hypothetical protein